MPAFFIVDLEVIDPVRFKDYAEAVPATVSAYGGKYIAAGGPVENIEGDWKPQRLIVIEFDSFERAKEWWASEEYRELKELRRETSHARILLADGL
jgi:uncharacterized protein (DUF1330 family)